MMQGLPKLETLDEHDDTGTTRSRLHMTKMDYDTITENESLTDHQHQRRTGGGRVLYRHTRTGKLLHQTETSTSSQRVRGDVGLWVFGLYEDACDGSGRVKTHPNENTKQDDVIFCRPSRCYCNSRRNILKVVRSLTELCVKNADLFSLGRTMSVLTSWGVHIAVYEKERQESEKQVKDIEDYEI